MIARLICSASQQLLQKRLEKRLSILTVIAVLVGEVVFPLTGPPHPLSLTQQT